MDPRGGHSHADILPSPVDTAGAAPGNPPGVSTPAGSSTDLGAPEADAINTQDFYELVEERGMPVTREFGSSNQPCAGAAPPRYRTMLQAFLAWSGWRKVAASEVAAQEEVTGGATRVHSTRCQGWQDCPPV